MGRFSQDPLVRKLSAEQRFSRPQAFTDEQLREIARARGWSVQRRNGYWAIVGTGEPLAYGKSPQNAIRAAMEKTGR